MEEPVEQKAGLVHVVMFAVVVWQEASVEVCTMVWSEQV